MIYVLQVKPSCDMAVRAGLVREGLAAYVPRRELIIRKSGGWSKEISLLFPGYVFIECDFTPEIFYTVKSVGDVVRWLGKPTPIKYSEENFLRLMINGGVPIPESTADVDSGGNVKITGGWLLDKQEHIKGYNIRKKRALLEIYFGGRIHRTSVGVEFTKA